jgi:hypothetical protein
MRARREDSHAGSPEPALPILMGSPTFVTKSGQEPDLTCKTALTHDVACGGSRIPAERGGAKASIHESGYSVATITSLALITA